MELSYKIKNADITNIEQIKELDNECFGMYPNEIYSLDTLKDLIESPTSLCCIATINSKEGEKAIGYIIIEQEDTEDCDDKEIKSLLNKCDINSTMIIYSIGVSEKYRKLGVAKNLIEHAVQLLKKRKVGILFLQVRESNVQAINLYRKHNFVKVINLDNYYHEPDEIGFYMMKIL